MDEGIRGGGDEEVEGAQAEDGQRVRGEHDELLALSLTDPLRLQQITHAQGRIILALDGLQPDVGHEVLWVLRDCLSAEVLLARSLLSATPDDLVAAIWPASRAIPMVKVSMSRQFRSLPKGSSVSTLASSIPNSPSAMIAMRIGDHQPLLFPPANGSESR